MSLLQILLCACAGLLAITFVFFFVVAVKSNGKKADNVEDVSSPETDSETISETPAEETANKDEEITSTQKEDSPAKLVIGDLVVETATESSDGTEKAKKVPTAFPEKLLALDISILDYYDSVNNKFIGYKRVHARISATGISYRFGKDLISKLSIKDDVLRIHFALPVSKYRFAKFKKEDLSDVRAYKEVPLTLNLTNVDELKSALSLIEDLEKNLGLEKKNRFLEVDSVAELKEIVAAK